MWEIKTKYIPSIVISTQAAWLNPVVSAPRTAQTRKKHRQENGRWDETCEKWKKQQNSSFGSRMQYLHPECPASWAFSGWLSECHETCTSDFLSNNVSVPRYLDTRGFLSHGQLPSINIAPSQRSQQLALIAGFQLGGHYDGRWEFSFP